MKLKRVACALLGSLLLAVFSAQTAGYALEGAAYDQDQARLARLTTEAVTSGKPVRIIVPSLHIDVPVVDGAYDPVTHAWSLGAKTAQYAVSTPLANDVSGNTFIYGHFNKYVFSNLIHIAPGAQVVIMTDNGHSFRYTYRTSFDVAPSTVSAIQDRGGPVLTVQTCVGSYFSLRRIFLFDYVSVDK